MSAPNTDREVYLDNSATTRVCRAAADKVYAVMTENYGNPSSLHTRGFMAEQELADARASVAQLIGARPEDVIFTSGGTEANNLAVLGSAAAHARDGRHIVTTAVEHSSVAACCDRLEKQGYEITRLQPDGDGGITAASIAAACRADTVLVAVMLVNNETGARFRLEDAVAAIRSRAPHAHIHADAVQAAGKLPLKAERWGFDSLSVSAHKLHGPKGSGALYLRRGSRIVPRQLGGAQERGLRCGTEAVPAIAGFGAAARQIPPYAAQQAHFEALRQRLIDGLKDEPAIRFHLPPGGVPYIVHFSVLGIRSETLLHFLAERQIYVSSGSACAKGAASPVLAAMRLPAAEIDSALRVTPDTDTGPEDIDRLTAAIREAMRTLVRR